MQPSKGDTMTESEIERMAKHARHAEIRDIMAQHKREQSDLFWALAHLAPGIDSPEQAAEIDLRSGKLYIRAKLAVWRLARGTLTDGGRGVCIARITANRDKTAAYAADTTRALAAEDKNGETDSLGVRLRSRERSVIRGRVCTVRPLSYAKH